MLTAYAKAMIGKIVMLTAYAKAMIGKIVMLTAYAKAMIGKIVMLTAYAKAMIGKIVMLTANAANIQFMGYLTHNKMAFQLPALHCARYIYMLVAVLFVKMLYLLAKSI